MRKCKKFQNYIDLYFDKDLMDSQIKELFAHMEQCQECHNLFLELKDMEKGFESIKKVVPSSDISVNVMSIINRESSKVTFLEKIREGFMSPVTLRANLAFITVLLLILVTKPYFITDKKIVNQKQNIEYNEFINAKFLLSLPENHIEDVSVVGDFNGWNTKSFKLNYKGNGIWEGTFPIKSGKYEYMFVINGEKWIPDPKAREYKEDGFGGKNSLLVL